MYRAPLDPDRRSSPRCAINLPVDIEIGGVTHHGRTRDLSVDGLAIVVEGRPGIVRGAKVHFGVELRYLEPTPVRLEGSAVVLRADVLPHTVLLALRPQWVWTSHGPDGAAGRGDTSDRTRVSG
jgi:PilZ domain-containing protein